MYLKEDNDASDLVQRQRLYLSNGRLLTAVESHAEAEVWYRRLMDVAPNAYLLVVKSLVAQDRRADAVRFCLELSDGKPDAEMAKLMANLMTDTTGNSAGLAELQPAVDAALQEYGEDTQLLQAEAVMRYSQGKIDEAIQLFRQVVERDPQDAMALNNLATLIGGTAK